MRRIVSAQQSVAKTIMTTFQESASTNAQKAAVKEVLDSTQRKAWVDALKKESGRGKAAAIGNVLDPRKVPGSNKGASVSSLFDGRKSLWDNFSQGTKRLSQELSDDAVGAVKKAVKENLDDALKIKALGLSAIIETGFKLHEKGWDLSKIEKKDVIEIGYGVGTGVAYGAVGAAVGTLIPVPVVGTAVGFLVGTAVGMAVDHLIKDGTVGLLDCLSG